MLTLGTAACDITPPPGSMMGCFPRTTADGRRVARRARGAHDPLTARALVLSDGHESVALCACDLTNMRRVDLQRVRAEVARSVPELAGSRTVLAYSHTHSSAETMYMFGNTPDDPGVEEIDRRIAAAIVEAHGDRQPVELSVATLDVPINHNRRVIGPDGMAAMSLEYREGATTGRVDPELAVLRFEGPEGPRAVLFRYAAHALTMGTKNDLYTADYPGVARGVVEQALPGAMAAFVNGAAGNVHPRQCMREGFEVMEAVGRQLGDAVLRALEAAQPVAVDRLRFATTRFDLPHRFDPGTTMSVELSCLALGDVVLGFVPGEPFVELQLAFRRAVAPQVGVFVGYANGGVGYLPDEAAFAHGGYGVEEDTRYPDARPEFGVTSMPRGTAERALRELTALAAAVTGG